MAETTPADGQAGDQSDQPQLNLQKVYVKDSSFEAPNAPQVFQDLATLEKQPDVQLNLTQTSQKLSDGMYEVVLTLTLTCTSGEHNVYLAEVHQAGVFGLTGFDAEAEAGILGSYCPNLLYPYARAVISAMILAGGFPPFLLQPINFDAIYAEQQQRAANGDDGANATPTLNS